MRKLVVGRGHLGQYIATKLGISSELHFKDNMDDLDERKLADLRPDVVINAAGKTDLPWCENNPHGAFTSNVIAPIALHRRCIDLNVRYVHLSSGCVWDGPFNKNGEAFKPNDPISPACFYSWTKALCDSILIQESNTVLILRPRQVYSSVASPRNTLDKLKNYKDLLDTPNSMTSADTIIKTINILLSTTPGSKIMNVYDKGYSTPFEVAKFLHEAGLRGAPGLLDKSSLDKWHKPRRVDVVLYDKTFESLINPPLVQDELQRVIAEFKKNILG
jgi:dTDP-4-dehydrorhamnose reductase